MKISIITVSYNSASTIEHTISSVLGQTSANVEYIIVDGASTDITLSILNKYSDKITTIISEADKGIYDAMNKGVNVATGEVIGILNSDDFFASPEVLQKVADSFTIPGVKACYGNIVYVDREDTSKVTRTWRAGMYSRFKWWFGWVPPHPAFFARRELYEQYGPFREDFPIAADYELLLRWCFKQGVRPYYIDETLVKMREGGFSAQSFRQRLLGWKELYRAWWVNGLVPPPTLAVTRILTKAHQFFIK